MARQLSDRHSEITILDRLSTDDAGNPTEITLYYDMPTTEDRVGYANEQITRKGNQVINNLIPTRIKYGLKILRGFKEGAFCDDSGRPISSDPGSPNYNAAWKTLVKKYAADIVQLLAVHVFENSAAVKGQDVIVASAPADTGDDREDVDSPLAETSRP